MQGTIRGQYELQQELGSGGMGKVYQAKDLKLNRTVAIKALLPAQKGNEERRRRFIVEAQSASALNHPNIITIFDIIDENGADYMVMEYLPGKTLLELIPREGLRVPIAVNYAVQIADGLSAAHAAGIVHRDLKPGNIIVSDRGFVKILDFGLAKLTESAPPDDPDATSDAPLTVEGSIMGTLSYMSPEQAQGKKVDARSDIFSFGAVLYEMISGQRAFTGESSMMTLTSVLRDEPRPLGELAPEAPPQLIQAVWKCLRKEPSQRWQRMEDLHQVLLSLKAATDSTSQSRVIPPPPPSTEPPPVSAAPILPPIQSWKKIPRIWIGLGVLFFIMFRGCRDNARENVKISTGDVKSVVKEAIEEAKGERLTNEGVINLVKAKVPESLIFSQIRSSKTKFDLSPDGIIELVEGGVPERVIEVMRDPAKAPQAVVTEVRVKPEATKLIRINDGIPVQLILLEDVPSDAPVGMELRFETASDLSVDGAIVIAKGSPARGLIVDRKRRRMRVNTSQIMFQLTSVRSAAKTDLKIRAVNRARDEDGIRALESSESKPKDVAAPKGAVFIAYVDGEQSIPAGKN